MKPFHSYATTNSRCPFGQRLISYYDQPSSHRVHRIGGFFHTTHQFPPSAERFQPNRPSLRSWIFYNSYKGADRLARYAFRCPTFGILQGNVPFPLNPPLLQKETYMRKRPIEVKFRLSEEEYQMLQRKLADAGMNRNAFLVQLILGADIYPRDMLMKLCVEYQIMNRLIRGISTNINQITKVANSTKAVPSAKLLVDMYQDIQVMQRNLQPLWEETRRITWRS